MLKVQNELLKVIYYVHMKNILITGVTKGIGKALAKKFLSEGHQVIGTSITGVVDFQDSRMTVVRLDLSLPESIRACAEEVASLGKKIDILINNAGVLLDVDLDHVDIEKLRKTLEVNLIGLIDFTERVIPFLNDGSHILNTSSSAGSLARTDESDDDHYPAYHISKTAINMYTRTLAVRLKGKATVSSYHPGWVKTDMGGMDADMTPEEAAEYIYDLAVSNVETGQFWFKGEKFPW